MESGEIGTSFDVAVKGIVGDIAIIPIPGTQPEVWRSLRTGKRVVFVRPESLQADFFMLMPEFTGVTIDFLRNQTESF